MLKEDILFNKLVILVPNHRKIIEGKKTRIPGCNEVISLHPYL